MTRAWQVERATEDPLAKLKLIAGSINEAMREARKIKELAVQEEVLVQLDKISSALELAKKEIASIMHS